MRSPTVNYRLFVPFILATGLGPIATAGPGSIESRFIVHSSVLPDTATGELFGSSFVPDGTLFENYSGTAGPLYNSSRNYTGIGPISGRALGPFTKFSGVPVRLWTESNSTQSANTYSAISTSGDGQTATYEADAATDHADGIAAAEASDPWGFNDGFFDILTELSLFKLEIETDQQKRANCIWESYLVDPNPGPFVKIDLSVIGEPGSSDDIEIDVQTGTGVSRTAAQIETMIRSNLVVTPGRVSLASPVSFGIQYSRFGPFEIGSSVRVAVAPVPEPASLAALAGGIVGVFRFRAKRRVK